MLEPNCVCVLVRVCVCACLFASYTVVNIYANLMLLLAGRVSSKRQKHNLALNSPDVAQAVMEAELLPCQDDPSPTNKPLIGNFNDLDIPYIDEEEDDEDAITA